MKKKQQLRIKVVFVVVIIDIVQWQRCSYHVHGVIKQRKQFAIASECCLEMW